MEAKSRIIVVAGGAKDGEGQLPGGFTEVIEKERNLRSASLHIGSFASVRQPVLIW